MESTPAPAMNSDFGEDASNVTGGVTSGAVARMGGEPTNPTEAVKGGRRRRRSSSSRSRSRKVGRSRKGRGSRRRRSVKRAWYRM